MTTHDDDPWGPRPSDTSHKKSGSSQESGDREPLPFTRQRHGWSGGGNGNGLPPDPMEILKNFYAAAAAYKPQSHLHSVLGALFLLLLLWLASGIYMVGADQLGVVMRFGAFNRTEQPGLRYRLPAPFESVSTPIVTAQNEIQIGFRKTSREGGGVRDVPEESMMLTQDENVINVQFAVFWRIGDVKDYLFQIRNPEITIKMAAESAMREVIGQNKLQFALTEGRSRIADDARRRLQEMSDEYKAGITITQINLQTVAVPDDVKAAFQDVVNARLDMERFQNQAAAHVNKVIPDAKGRAAKLIQEAMAYRDQKIAVAKGDADRFREVLASYALSKDVTTKRLYFETMESVLGNASKVIAAPGAGSIPLYPLQDILRNKTGEGKAP